MRQPYEDKTNILSMLGKLTQFNMWNLAMSEKNMKGWTQNEQNNMFFQPIIPVKVDIVCFYQKGMK